MKTFKQFREELAAAPGAGGTLVSGAPTNNVGSGHLAGTIGEPPVSKAKQAKYKRGNKKDAGTHDQTC